MIKSPIIIPKATKGWVSRTSVLGTSTYDLNNLYSPDTALAKSCVLDLVSPKYEPNKTTIFDRSRYNNHGTITGATWEREPSGERVIYQDAVDDVTTCADAGGILASATMSGLIWINFKTIPGPYAANPCIFGKKVTTYDQANGWQEYFNNGEGKLSLRGASATEGKSGVVSIVAGKWYLIGFVAVGTTVTHYLNGVSVGSGTITAISSNTDQFRIGKLSNDFPSLANIYWQGVRLLNNLAVSATQIANIFNSERHLFGV